MIHQILEQREPSSWGIGLRGNVPEVVLAGNAGIYITRRGARSDVDSDCSDKVRDSV